jgi:hypothetical protein
MGLFIKGYWGEKYGLLFIVEMQRKAFIKERPRWR